MLSKFTDPHVRIALESMLESGTITEEQIWDALKDAKLKAQDRLAALKDMGTIGLPPVVIESGIILQQPKKKRHRRTKAEMEAARRTVTTKQRRTDPEDDDIDFEFDDNEPYGKD